MKIRPAMPVDIPRLLDLARAAATTAQWSAAQYSEMLSDPSRLVLVIEDEEGIHGFLVAQTRVPEWELENIVVDRERRRRGIATILLNSLLEDARRAQAEALLLEVRASNEAARAFYRRNEFIESGTRRNYYRNPEEDAILYSLGLI